MNTNELNIINALSDMVNKYNKVLDIINVKIRQETAAYYKAASAAEQDKHFDKMTVYAELYSEILNQTKGA